MKTAALNIVLGAAALLLSACLSLPSRARLGPAQATAARDSVAPAVVERERAAVELPVAEGSLVVVDATRPQRVEIVPSAATVLRVATDHERAQTGAADPTVLRERARQGTATALGRHRMTIGAGLIILGVVVGFALPAPLRWPLAGAMLGGVGLLLVILPTPEPWMIAAGLGVAAGVPLAYYSTKATIFRRNQNMDTDRRRT
jgi:hypothetical protein